MFYRKFGLHAPRDHRLTFYQFVEMIKELKDNEELQKEIVASTVTFYEKYTSGGYTIRPDSRRLFQWNMGTTMLVIYSAFLVPTRIAFDSTPDSLTLALDYVSELWFMFMLSVIC